MPHFLAWIHAAIIAGMLLIPGVKALASHHAPAGSKDPDILDMGRPAVRLFSDADGLPQNTIEALAIDKEGCIWAGTQDGAARYNGKKWVPVPLPNSAPGNWVRSLLILDDGSVWIGTFQGGVYCLRQGQWESFSQDLKAPQSEVNTLVKSSDGGLWAGAAGGLFKWKGGRWTSLPLPLQTGVQAIREQQHSEGDSSLWVGTDQGLGHFRHGRWNWYKKEAGLPSDAIRSLHLSQDSDDDPDLWIGTNLGLARWKGPQRERVALPGGAFTVVHISETMSSRGEQTLWFGTGNGLLSYTKGRWKTFNSSLGLPTFKVRCVLAQTPPGGRQLLWVGTFSGLLKLSDEGWMQFKQPGSMAEAPVCAITESRQGGYWLGTFGTGLRYLRPEGWKHFGPNTPVPDRHIMALLETTPKAGPPALWVGTLGNGLLKLQGGKSVRYSTGQGLPAIQVFSLKEMECRTGEKTVWVGTGNGPAVLINGRFEIPAEFRNMDGGEILAMLEGAGHQGVLTKWFATRNKGLFQVAGQQIRNFKQSDGLVSNEIYCLLRQVDADGIPWLWMGFDKGCCRIRLDQSFRECEKIQALSGLQVLSLLLDVKGNIYASTHKGVIKITPRHPDKGDTSLFSFQRYSVGDGLPSVECTQGGGYVDSKGRIWVGTLFGAAMLEPEKDSNDRTRKHLFFENIQSGTNRFSEDTHITLDWRQPHLTVEYALLNYFREEDTCFRTWIEGMEKVPGPWTSQSRQEYPCLPAGNYTFHVWGKDASENVSGPIHFHFDVPAPPYWRPWAWCLYLAIGTALIHQLYLAMERRFTTGNRDMKDRLESCRKLHQQTQSELEEIRNQSERCNRNSSYFYTILRHSLRHPLNEINGMAKSIALRTSSPMEREIAEGIHGIADNLIGTINEIIDYSGNTSALREKISFNLIEEMEACLASFAESAHRKGLELVGHFEPELPSKLLGDLASLRQLVVHLLSYAIQFTREGEVRLRLGVETDKNSEKTKCPLFYLRLEVSDTGIGLSDEALQKILTLDTTEVSSAQGYEEGALGLSLCRRILERLGGNVQVESEVSSGTSFLCRIPFEITSDFYRETPINFHGCKVLIFDANESLLHSLASTLRQWNLRPVLFNQWEQLRLSLEDGLTALDAKAAILGLDIRETEPAGLLTPFEGRPLPRMIMVGSAAIDSCEKMKMAGKADYLLKPFRRAQLMNILARILEVTVEESIILEHVEFNPDVWEGLQHVEAMEPGTLLKLINHFTLEAPAHLEKISLSLTHREPEIAERSIFAFKNLAESLGISIMVEYADHMLQEAKKINYDEVEELIAQCRALLPVAISALQAKTKVS